MTSSTNPKTILLKGDPAAREYIAAAASAIKPGHLLKEDTAGKVIQHATAGGNAAKLFARENELTGHGIDDVYAVGDNVYAWACKPGDVIYAWLKAGAGGDVPIGTFLESAGDGTLRDVATSGYIVAKALEAVDNDPGTGSAAVRIKVEVI